MARDATASVSADSCQPLTRARWMNSHTLLVVGDRWGDDGPPADAYERHSRDLAAVTAGFASYLDELPTRLTIEYDCELREATARDVEWLRDGPSVEFEEALAVRPHAAD